MDYRDLLYKRYHSQHTSQHTGLDASALQLTEAVHFQREWSPLLVELNRDSVLLDIGCGNGSLMVALHQLGFEKIQGIDISEEQIQIARQSGLNEAKVADATAYLKDKFGLFDAVFCMDLVEHLTKSELVELLLLIRQALKPNGKLFLRTPNMDSPWPHVYASGDYTHETLLNTNSIRQVLGSVGYEQVRIYPSLMRVSPWWKEMMRKFMYQMLTIRWHLELFATARSSQGIVWSPNLLVHASAPPQQ